MKRPFNPVGLNPVKFADAVDVVTPLGTWMEAPCPVIVPPEIEPPWSSRVASVLPAPVRVMPPAPVAIAPVLMSLLEFTAMLAAVAPALVVTVLLVIVRLLAEVRVPVLVKVLSVTVTAPADTPARVDTFELATVNCPVPVRVTAPLVSTVPEGMLTLPPPLIAPTLRM